MTDKTIAILRQPSDLVAVVSCRHAPFSVPSVGGWTREDPYYEKHQPLSEVDDLSVMRLVEPWKRLGRVAKYDQQTIDDICEVLDGTIAAKNAPCSPAWRPPEEAKPIRATAANPRAFRGTKFQPPSQRQPEPVDLRPFLCNSRDCAELGRYLQSKFADPKLAASFESQRVLLSLPDKIRNAFGLLYVKGEEFFAQATGFYWELGLDQNDVLRRCVSRLVDIAEPGADFEFGWLEIVKQLPRDRQVATVELLIESKLVWRADLTNRVAELFLRLNELSSDGVFCERTWAFFESARCSCTLEGLVNGMELANTYHPQQKFTRQLPSSNVNIDSIIEWVEHVRVDEDGCWDRQAAAMHFWSACQSLPGLARLMEVRMWEGLGCDEAYDSFEPFTHCQWTDDEDFDYTESYLPFLKRADEYFSAIKSLLPDYQMKGIHIFRDGVPDWIAEDVGTNFDRTFALIQRVCREPFVRKTDRYLYCELIFLPLPQFERLVQASDQSFRAYEKACASQNDATLIVGAIRTVIKLVPERFVRGFWQCPTLMFRTLKTLGTLAAGAREVAVRTWLKHPLQNIQIEELDLKALVQRIELHRPVDIVDPIPAKVRRFANGEWNLTKAQQSRARTNLRNQLFETQVDLLNHVVAKILATGVGVDVQQVADSASRHAVHALNQMGRNRRALRRFLKAYFDGETNYIESHPLNKKWLAQHPKLDLEKWTRGLAMSRSIVVNNEQIELMFSIETDPLEVLRSGTYVGSCLGIGGVMIESAGAIVLDINKSIVYARNQRGRVVARQLLAVCEDDRLVCFDVYPSSTSRKIRQSFVEFDEAFAKHLGVELYRASEDDDGYSIENPVSNYWWDDVAWAFELD